MKKIIIIEDEEVLLNLLQKKLVQVGYRVEVARDGEEGLKKIKEDKPDLILLDILMPKVGGFEVMKALNKDERFKNIPIIIISNSGQPVELELAKKLGVRDWLIKANFDPQEVVNKVEKQMDILRKL
ncbi:MAG: response regulator [Patescibacteria group bacterium]|nr:response regulator [Patescibacteria group bacterium]